MRLVPFCAFLLLGAVLCCGCLQPAPPAATPAPATPPAPTVTAPAGPKEVNVSVWTTDTAVVLRLDGGKDATGLTQMKVVINNRDGKIVKTPIYSPEVGREYLFPYVGIVNPNTINIVGVFSDGTEQTILIYYF